MSDPEIVGQKIREVRRMNKKELQAEGWDDWNNPPSVIILANGVKLYPSRDDEGNGPGTLFGRDTKGSGFAL